MLALFLLTSHPWISINHHLIGSNRLGSLIGSINHKLTAFVSTNRHFIGSNGRAPNSHAFNTVFRRQFAAIVAEEHGRSCDAHAGRMGRTEAELCGCPRCTTGEIAQQTDHFGGVASSLSVEVWPRVRSMNFDEHAFFSDCLLGFFCGLCSLRRY